MTDFSTMETIIGIMVLVYVPIVQFVGMKYGLNGLREDVKAIKVSVQALNETLNDQAVTLGRHHERIGSLERPA